MKTRNTSQQGTSEKVKGNRKRLLTNETPFAIKEAYIKLRTNLMFCLTADKQRACKVFAVTSSQPSEGKSLTAANIAISFAMMGRSTVLIDADMRKPTQRRLWRANINTGLCDFLAKIAPIEMVQVKDLPLSIICTGTIPPNPSELIASERMKQFIGECAVTYDYVIIDTPPINTVADAQIIASFVDGMIFVAKSGTATAEEMNLAIDTLRHSGGNLCGVVLNDLNMKSIKSSYRYKYSSKYGYSRYGYSRYGYSRYGYARGSAYANPYESVKSDQARQNAAGSGASASSGAVGGGSGAAGASGAAAGSGSAGAGSAGSGSLGTASSGTAGDAAAGRAPAAGNTANSQPGTAPGANRPAGGGK